MATANTNRKVQVKGSLDLYNTSDEALELFYKNYPEVFESYYTYYDPCNGLGKISNFLKKIGKQVYTSDIYDYGCQDWVEDFLKNEEIPEDVECIIFNPPFTLTKEFVDHAYDLMQGTSCNNILMFNRLTTIESKERARRFKDGRWNLQNMYQYGGRVSCTKGENEEPMPNAVAYAWFELSKYKRSSHFDQLKWIL